MIPETLDWAQETLDLEYYTNTVWKFDIETITLNPEGVTEEGMGMRYIDPIEAAFEEGGGQILLDTMGKELLMEDGAVVGVVAEDKDGNTVTIKSDAVIIATGGFAGQVGQPEGNDVINTFLPELTDEKYITGDLPFSNGSGIMMAVDAGADTIGLTGTGVRGNYRLEADPDALLKQNGLFVNQDAERFANEGMQYQVFYTALPQNYTVYEITDSASQRENAQELVETGTVHQADTIEELAEAVGLDPEKLVAEVEAYNQLVEAGEDTEFGKGPQFLSPVAEAPFYIAETFPRIAGSIGGIKTDENTQVVDADGNVIPGLYACGDAMNGNLHNEQYVGGGSGTTWALNTGRIAGENASK